MKRDDEFQLFYAANLDNYPIHYGQTIVIAIMLFLERERRQWM